MKDLWTILEPSAEQVNIEALTGKRVAVDASIWMIQFIKAMRDDNGEAIANAHILGFLKRIVRLMHYRVYPVFVFDGRAPKIKRECVRLRKMKSNEQKVTLRKAAETLLMNSIERGILEEQLGRKVEREMDLDEEFWESTVVKGEEERLRVVGVQEKALTVVTENADDDADDDDVRGKKRTRRKFIDVVDDDDEEEEDDEETDPDEDFSAWDVELPTNKEGKIDPAVLGALPVSMQLETMKRIREENVGKNRAKFQAVEKDSTGFSQLQIEQYLESTKLRKEMDVAMRKSGKQFENGDMSRKIAAQDGVEFVFHRGGASSDRQHQHQQLSLRNGNNHNNNDNSNNNNNNRTLPNGQTRDLLEDSYRGFASYQSGVTKLLNNRPQVQSFYQEKKSRKGQQDLSAPRKELIISSALNEHLPGPTIARSVAEMPHRDPSKFVEQLNNGRKKQEHLSSELRIQISKKELEEMKTVDPMFEDEERDKLREITEEEENEDEDEWEDVEDDEEARHLKIIERVLEEKKEKKIQEEDGENPTEVEGGVMRKTTRDVYSGTHGFVRGKSLGQWDSDGEDEDDEEEKAPKALPAPVEKVKNEEIEDEEEEEEEEFVNVSSSSDDEDKVELREIELEKEKKEYLVDDDDDEEDRAAVATDDDDEEEDEEALQRAIFLSLERDRPGRVGGFRRRKRSSTQIYDDEEREDEEIKKNLVVQEKTVEKNFGLEEGDAKAAAAFVEKIDEKRKEKMVSFLEEEEEEGEEKEEGGKLQMKTKEINSLPLAPPQVYTPSSFHTDTPENEFFKKFRIKSDIEQEIERDMMEDEEMFEDAQKIIDESERRKKINSMLEENAIERENLEAKRRKAQKVYSEQPTTQMYREVQEMLSLFGIPFVMAPEEAEAECAHLNATGKVDGVFTNDSDVFLFGATLVFRNAFENTKKIQMYKSERIEKQLGLTRERMIQLAMLLGSDYTVGIDGIGIVNAMEVLAGFSDLEGLEGLVAFKKWSENQTLSLPGPKGAKVRRHLEKMKLLKDKEDKEKDDDGDDDDDNDDIVIVASRDGEEKKEEEEADDAIIDDTEEADNKNITAARRRFYEQHQTSKLSWKFPNNFPDNIVRLAYTEPKVDPSEENFVWDHSPMENDILEFFRERLNWPDEFTTETVRPMYEKIKERNEKYKQRTMRDFFTALVQNSEGFTKIKSKRLALAVADLKGEEFDSSIVFPEIHHVVAINKNDGDDDDIETNQSPSSKKNKKKKTITTTTTATTTPKAKKKKKASQAKEKQPLKRATLKEKAKTLIDDA